MPKRTFFRLDEDKRERVIRSAIDEFRQNGFENAKVGAIAQAAGVANGSIYQYFDDKRELFMYCVNWTLENFVREIDRQLPLAGMDLFEYFQSRLLERITYWRNEPALAMFTHELMSGRIDFPHGEANTVRDVYGANIPKLIANGHKWGTLRDDADDGLLTLFFSGVVREAEDMIYAEAAPDGFVISGDKLNQYAGRMRMAADLLKNGLAMKRADG